MAESAKRLVERSCHVHQLLEGIVLVPVIGGGTIFSIGHLAFFALTWKDRNAWTLTLVFFEVTFLIWLGLLIWTSPGEHGVHTGLFHLVDIALCLSAGSILLATI